MDTETFDLTSHKDRLCAKADEIIGIAMQLRAGLRLADNLPLPEDAGNALIRALTDFVREAEKCHR